MDKQNPKATTPRIRRRSVTVDEQLNEPKGLRPALTRRSSDRFGRFTESVARAMGTPWFLIGLSFFVVLWMTYNTLVPVGYWLHRADTHSVVASVLCGSTDLACAKPTG